MVAWQWGRRPAMASAGLVWVSMIILMTAVVVVDGTCTATACTECWLAEDVGEDCRWCEAEGGYCFDANAASGGDDCAWFDEISAANWCESSGTFDDTDLDETTTTAGRIVGWIIVISMCCVCCICPCLVVASYFYLFATKARVGPDRHRGARQVASAQQAQQPAQVVRVARPPVARAVVAASPPPPPYSGPVDAPASPVQHQNFVAGTSADGGIINLPPLPNNAVSPVSAPATVSAPQIAPGGRPVPPPVAPASSGPPSSTTAKTGAQIGGPGAPPSGAQPGGPG